MAEDRSAAVTVRPAVDADAAVLATLAGQLGYPVSVAHMLPRLQALRRGVHDEVLVAQTGVLVCGWIAVSMSATLTHDAQAEILGLIVDAGHRGARIGATLVRAAENWASEHGCARIRVRSNVLREDAHRFYDRERYARLKTQLLFGKELEAAAR